MPRLLSKAPRGIPLRQQAHRLHQNGMSPTYRFQQTQRNYSPRRQIPGDEKREKQSSGLCDRVVSHFKRNEMTYENIMIGCGIFAAVIEAINGPGPPNPPKPGGTSAKSDMATFTYVNPIPGFW
ncbi:unnamed protein product [Fusarium fujikuroi]|uniref:Uncharacterized protein n=1 Tax=Fusarium fujikuroi TaxID=5127 RepID=A0A9Q9RPE1_FUSFU|nr:unnamed protein product [Fusarium fujikuroi]VTT72100.1 unnamed protein product [Fusarium fujikuroi]VZH87531.1 unnamed protein product [Fusarium fujikuroi]